MTAKSQSYTAMIEVAKPPQHVFECILDVSKWWGGKDLKGSSRLINDEFTIKHGDVHFSKQRVIEIVPGQRVVWLVADLRLSGIPGSNRRHSAWEARRAA